MNTASAIRPIEVQLRTDAQKQVLDHMRRFPGVAVTRYEIDGVLKTNGSGALKVLMELVVLGALIRVHAGRPGTRLRPGLFRIVPGCIAMPAPKKAVAAPRVSKGARFTPDRCPDHGIRMLVRAQHETTINVGCATCSHTAVLPRDSAAGKRCLRGY